MSSQSGISPSTSLQSEFQAAAQNSSILFVKFEIQTDTFVKTGEGNAAGSRPADLKAIQGVLIDKQPCYVVFRLDQLKWCCLCFIPNDCPVRLKMFYASSKAALKSGLGGDKFGEDYNISDKKECTSDDFSAAAKGVGQDIVMSADERMYHETRHEHSAGTSEGKVSAIVGIPIRVADATLEALKGIASGKVSSLELVIDASTETLGNAPITNTALSALQLPEREPRFFVVMYKYVHDGANKSKLLLIYYCPNKAIPKLKMLYSTSKANVVKIFETLQIKEFHNLEVNEVSELADAVVIADIHPPTANDRGFSKPKAGGRGKAKLATKFNADA
jgi:twinfilin-like protein